MTKILIAESLDSDILKKFTEKENIFIHMDKPPSLGDSNNNELHFVYLPNITKEQIEELISDYQGLIVRPKEVTKKAIKNGKSLKIIVRGGSGVNSIDLKAAQNNGVVVENTPGQNSVSTAEYTFALIMETVARRNIQTSVEDVKNYRCKEPELYQGQELEGKKLAIIGMGNIGQKVATYAEAFNMDISFYNRSKKNVPFTAHDSIESLIKYQPDVICLHIPLTEKTNKFFGTTEFSLMKKGSIVINTARPQLIDEKAFGQALKEEVLLTAAIDGDLELIEPFIKYDIDNKCIFTHHIADSTKQAQEKITNAVLEQMIKFFHNNKIINEV